MTYSKRNILIAVVLAVAAGVLVLLYTTSYKEQVTQGQERVKVLVATEEIPAGTPGEKAAAKMVLKEVVADAKTPGALETDAPLKAGELVATQKVYAGQQVILDVFQPGNQVDTGQNLKGVNRAVRVEVSRSRGMIGDIKQGDRVDVFGSFTVRDTEGNETGVARRLFENVKVLQVPEEEEKKRGAGAAEDVASIMLEVTQADATKLAFMAADPTARILYVAARPAEGGAPEDQEKTIEDIISMVTDGMTAAEIRQRVPAMAGEARAKKAAEKDAADAAAADAAAGTATSTDPNAADAATTPED